MDAPRFEGLSRAMATGPSRRQLVRLLAGSALAGAGLVRRDADAGAGGKRGKRCCRKQQRHYQRSKEDCEERGGTFPQAFSCDRATCDPNETVAYLCLMETP
jgi:hypothetical protein